MMSTVERVPKLARYHVQSSFVLPARPVVDSNRFGNCFGVVSKYVHLEYMHKCVIDSTMNSSRPPRGSNPRMHTVCILSAE